MAGGKMSSVKILRIERRAKVVELRKKGYSYRAIADEIRQVPQFGQPSYSEATAREDCKHALRQLAEDTRNDVVELRQLELERLNLALSSIALLVEQGSLPAIDRWLKTIDLRCKILGLNLEQDAINKAFSAFRTYGYEIRYREGGGYELIDLQAPSIDEIESH